MGPNNQAHEIQSQTETDDNEIYSIGRLLRETREEKRLTIAEVAVETKIRQVYIKAIEEGALESLPGEIYKVGFIKSYASFLGLDTVEILRRTGLHEQDVQVSYANNTYVTPTEYQRHPNKKILYLSLVGVLVFSIFAYIIHHSDKRGTAVVQETLSENNTVPDVERLDPGVSLESLEAPATAEIEKEEQPLAPHLDSSHLTTPEMPAMKTASSVPESPQIPTSALDESSMSISENDVMLTAVKDTWVQILDGSEKTVYVRLMHAGDTYKVPTNGIHTLNTGNAGGLKITLNGNNTKLLGADGQVIRGVLLTESGLKSFY
ncbi:helix-turn-helix domain-containing protein [Candidatus Paracaedibacter symbiosus]|uniref:helix-turn-helix domain-containing protein n=1 Tax=Candidatus Paracaedibacter symbiosus TaxID=244582 RepID=UPI000509D536|nr:helix-turn-helix domain-containing protein [Candidatus Paracaedibacter symbiosus]